jgi:hypothetical protein
MTLSALAIVASSAHPSVAQEGLLAGFGPAGTFPSGLLGTAMGESGAGMFGEASLPLGETGLRLGVSLGWSQYAHYRRTILYDGGGGESFEVEETTGHNLVLGHLYLRRDLGRRRVRPYLEGLVGFVYPYTRSELSGLRVDEYDPVGRSLHTGDTALSLGVGAGLDLRIGAATDPAGEDEAAEGSGSGWPEPRLSVVGLRLRWLSGASADWVVKGSVTVAEGDFFYETRRSDSESLQLTILFLFGF